MDKIKCGKCRHLGCKNKWFKSHFYQNKKWKYFVIKGQNNEEFIEIKEFINRIHV